MITTPASNDRALVIAGAVFAVGSAIHITDHLRRGQGSISETLYVLGNVALVLQVVAVVLIFVDHRQAPLVAAGAGPALAVGFTAAHWLPDWGPISDPVWEIDSAPWFSAFASAAEVIGAIAIGYAGIRIVRRNGLASYATTA